MIHSCMTTNIASNSNESKSNFSAKTDCIFCKIAQKTLSTPIIFENENIIAFNDINPQAPIHILIIPKAHLASINEAEPRYIQTLGEILLCAKEIAAMKGCSQNGYRLVINTNDDAGQTVWHLHVHLLAGRKLTWPPG